MARFDNPLDNLRVASPCNADWDQMVGSERTRFCGQCNLHVYNLSSMSKAEAEHLIGVTEGRLCVRYYKRADGSILTSDCPVGLRAFRRKMSYAARAITSAVLSFLAGLGVYTLKSSRFELIMGAPRPTRVLPVVQESSNVLMGDIVEQPSGPEPRCRRWLISSRGSAATSLGSNRKQKRSKRLFPDK